MDIQLKRELLVFFYTHNRSATSAIRKYCSKYKIKSQAKKPSKRMLQRLVNKFEQYGTIHNRSSSGRGDVVKSDDIEAVELSIQALNNEGILPTTRSVGTIVSRSHSTVGKIMKKNLFLKPYKIQTCQFLTAAHKEQRLRFSKIFLIQFRTIRRFLKE